MTKRVYVIRVQKRSEWGCKNSDEAYTTLAKAQKFIESRSDKPKKAISDYYYESAEYRYFIDELVLM